MDRWGRRPALLFAILPLFSGWILIATASSHTLILCGRIVAGVAVGLIAAPAQVKNKKYNPKIIHEYIIQYNTHIPTIM